MALGTARGYVTLGELSERLAGIEADGPALEAVLGMLDSAGIRVQDAPDPEPPAARPQKPASREADFDIPDALAAYERDLERVVPLKPESESRISAQLAEALTTLRELAARLPPEHPARRPARGRGPLVKEAPDTGGDDPAALYEWAVECEHAAGGRPPWPSFPLDQESLAKLVHAREAIDSARLQLIQGTMRLVFHLARHYQDRGVELLDLVQEGNAGLLRAVQRFDPARGSSFASYATWWIRQAQARAVREQGKSFRVPQSLDSDLRRIGLVRRRLTQSLDREPSLPELSEELGVDEATLDRALRFTTMPLRLDEPVSEGDSGSLEGVLEVHDGASRPPDGLASSLRGDIERVLATLEPREQDLMRLRYGLHDGVSRPLEDVARALKITRERARQIEERALRKLRHPTRRRQLDLLD
jgi:RNA polymerase nonessential primary-like sigma factor